MKIYKVVAGSANLIDNAFAELEEIVNSFTRNGAELIGGVNVIYIPANGKFVVSQALLDEVDTSF